MEPVPDLAAGPDGRRLADEDEEGGLEGVLGVMGVAQDATADAQHHRPMPAHECLERILILPANESFQQLAVGAPVRVCPVEDGPKALDESAQLAFRHDTLPGR